MSQTSQPRPLQQRDPRRVWVSPLAWVILLVLALYFFTPLSTIALGVLAACIIASTLYPVVIRIPGPRAVGVAVAALTLLTVLGAVGFSLAWPLHAPISRAIADWPSTKQKLDSALTTWGANLGLLEPPKVDRILDGLSSFLVGQGGQQLFSRSADMLLGILVSLTFAVIGSIFLLGEDPKHLLRPGLRVLSPELRPLMEEVLADLALRFRRWVIGTLTGMCVVFTATSIGFTSIGLDFAIPLALLAGFAEIVPTVGPAVACGIAVVFAAATQSASMALGVLIVCAIVQAFEAYIILPQIMRGAVNIPPAITLFTVILWGKIFGVPGLILAIPINLTIWSLLEHFRFRRREPADAGAGDAAVPSPATPDAREASAAQ